MEQSILKSVKKLLGIGDDDDSFDLDVLMHINTVFSNLTQLGIGPPEGFAIEDDSKEWKEFLQDDVKQSAAKSYVYLRVRMLFDPPASSFAIVAFEKQIEELGWRLNVDRESDEWVNPNPERSATHG